MTDHNFTISPVDTAQGRMYCGPTVLAFLTGKTRAEIHADVNRARRRAGAKRRKTIYYRDGFYKTQKLVPWPLTAPVKGMHNWMLQEIMERYGLAPEKHNVSYPSLRRLVEDMGHFKVPIVINVTHHYVLYFQGKVYDTFCKEGCPVEEHPSAGQRVQKYWLIRKQKSAMNTEVTEHDASAV